MAAENFNDSLVFVFRLEGGFVDDPADPGGATNLGVTVGTWSAWVGRAVGVAEIRALTPATVRPLYRKNYWDAASCDDWAPGVDLMVFDAAVNMGVGHAVRFLQRAAGALEDGVVGPATRAAVAGQPPDEMVSAMADERRAYYRELSTFGRFGRGWLNRVAQVEARAKQMEPAP